MILVGSDYWGGLIDWLKDRMMDMGFISESDLNFLQVVDTADEVVSIVKQFLDTSRHV
jgi:predicted Rossmann-fold nucleotide-binding protein